MPWNAELARSIPSRPTGEVGDEALAGRVPRRVEETAQEGQYQELPEKQPTV